jgi:hypothetical protein
MTVLPKIAPKECVTIFLNATPLEESVMSQGIVWPTFANEHKMNQ